MSAFQNLKDKISEIRKTSSNFAELDMTNFPEGEVGDGGVFNVAEACALLEHFIKIVEVALENKRLCIENVSPNEMDQVGDLLTRAVNKLQNNNVNFVNRLVELIVFIRPFAMLSMEKMDSKRYREIGDLEDILAKIRQRSTHSVRAYHRVVKAEGKISELDNLVGKNQELSNESTNMHAKMTTLLGEIQGMHDVATSQKEEIDRFSSQIQDREKDFALQKVMTEDYEKKLESFSTEHGSLILKAQELIDLAEKALQLRAAQGLGAAFKAKEDKSGCLLFKALWLLLGLGAAGVAIYLGWLISNNSGMFGTGTVLGRSLVMIVAVGVAGFAGKQYANNKAIEEDYAYKAALVASYPGFASKLDNEEMQKQYTSQLLAEILQDPQRDRKTAKKKLFISKRPHLGN